jgi:hypothetical protein
MRVLSKESFTEMLLSLGGVVSFAPPDGGMTLAQAENKNGNTNKIENRKEKRYIEPQI